jgi:uncharacterized membrane protein YbhN (UPF0104 family)
MLRRDRLPAIAFWLKLAITIGLFAYLLRKVEIGPVVRQLGEMAPAAALGAEILFLLQLGLLAWRWQIVSGIAAAPIQAMQALRLSAIGHFFNQVLPSGFAGDAARAWLAAREGIRVGPAVRAILCDRVIGLLVLILMVSVALFALPDLTADKVPGRSSFALVALLGVGGLAVLLVLGVPLARLLARHPLTRSLGTLTDDLHRALFRSGGRSAVVVVLALGVQLLNVAAMHWCAKGMHIDLDFATALVIVPAVMLVSMAPISFAGWGVREGAMIVGLGLAGIAAADALAVSVAFGLLQLVLGLPGGALWLARRSAPADRAQPPEPG